MSNPYDKQVGGDHYSKMKIQPAEFINKNKMMFAEGNAIKYICRHINKGGEQDLQKAKHYIDMIIERDYGDDAVVMDSWGGAMLRVNDSKVRFTNPKTLKTEEVDLSRLIRVFVNNQESHKRSVK